MVRTVHSSEVGCFQLTSSRRLPRPKQRHEGGMRRMAVDRDEAQSSNSILWRVESGRERNSPSIVGGPHDHEKVNSGRGCCWRLVAESDIQYFLIEIIVTHSEDPSHPALPSPRLAARSRIPILDLSHRRPRPPDPCLLSSAPSSPFPKVSDLEVWNVPYPPVRLSLHSS